MLITQTILQMSRSLNVFDKRQAEYEGQQHDLACKRIPPRYITELY